MFDFFKPKPLNYNNIDKAELALQLFEHLFLGTEKDYSAQLRPYVKDFLQKNDSRISQLNAIGRLCMPYDTPKKMYIASQAYIWAGATGRAELIKILPKYIEQGAKWEGSVGGMVTIDFATNRKIPRHKLELADLYNNLGKAYEGEYMLEDACNTYKEAIKTLPSCSYYINLAKCLVKLGRFDEALHELETFKLSEYCSKEQLPHLSEVIADITSKKERGYKYRPRPQKLNFEERLSTEKSF